MAMTTAVGPQPTDDRWSFLTDQLRRATSSALRLVTIPALERSAERLVHPAARTTVFWDAPGARPCVALGAAVSILAEGPDRSSRVRAQASEVFAEIDHVSAVDSPPEARLFGGFAFQPGRATAPPWEGFGDAHFILPRACYRSTDEGVTWTVAATAAELGDADRARSIADEIRALENRVASSGRAAANGEPVVVATEEMPPEDWAQLVERIREDIRAGQFEKIVASRRTMLAFEAPISPAAVLASLENAADCCTRFAFRFGGSTFVGATPERLIEKRGLDVTTEALAGSNRLDDKAAAGHLLSSTKERSEHQLVLDEIVRCLEPLCEALDYSKTPTIRELRHLMHLRTAIRARLSRPTHILDLVDRLHPTPAVGGVPTAEAVQWIAEHEPTERGWYAAPVGWFDAQGDGHFEVALRSGVLCDEHAYLFAGGGIVRDSDPTSEYAETRLKLASLSTALHVPR